MKTIEQIRKKLRTIFIDDYEYMQYYYFLRGNFSKKEIDSIFENIIIESNEIKYLNIDDFIKWFDNDLPTTIEEYQDLSLPFNERLEQNMYLLQDLIQIKDYYNQQCKDKYYSHICNYVITALDKKLLVINSTSINCIFKFRSKKLRDAFFVNFKEQLQLLADNDLI